MRRLLAVPPAEVAAKRAELLRVRERFFWHADSSSEGATRQLIFDMCNKPHGRRVGGWAPPLLPVYHARPKDETATEAQAKQAAASAAQPSGYKLYVNQANL